MYLIDIGHSLAKIAESQSPGKLSDISILSIEEISPSNLPIPAIISCVNATLRQQLKNITGIKILKPADIPINTAYDKTLIGTDRLLACLGALKNTSITDFILIDAGTFITIEKVINSKHSGGAIMPGIGGLINLYEEVTSNRFSYQHTQDLESANTTQKAISLAISQMLGLIKDENLPVIVTGGNADIICEVIKEWDIDCRVIENLVLIGLSYINE